jgi:hypothetical protein
MSKGRSVTTVYWADTLCFYLTDKPVPPWESSTVIINTTGGTQDKLMGSVVYSRRKAEILGMQD